jgi:uncharacterized protein YutD
MNDVIEKLLIKAFFDESADVPSNKIYTLNDFMMQNFAELVIMECANLSCNYLLVRADRSYLIDKVIKDHFGVE